MVAHGLSATVCRRGGAPLPDVAGSSASRAACSGRRQGGAPESEVEVSLENELVIESSLLLLSSVQGGAVARACRFAPLCPLPGTSPPQGGRGERANDDLLIIVRKVEALQKLLDSETGANLRVGAERALNILAAEEKKDGAGAFESPVDRSLLSEPAERELAHVIEAVGGHVDDHVAREDYEGAFAALAELRPAVDAFFDHVMVNADDAAVRANRLALLAGLRAVTRKLADFSKIAG